MEKKRILLVDDDVDVINIITTILENENYEVITANGKTEAIEKARKFRPAVAILDVMMSTHYEGFELAQEIKKYPELKKTKLVMNTSIDVLTTSRGDVEAMAREFRLNADYKELRVLLIKDNIDHNAGIDYLTEDGKSVFFRVDGFLRKPIDSSKLIPELERLIKSEAIA